jgi:hypothetical protein
MKFSCKHIAITCLLSSALLMNTGCATIFGHSNYKVNINSNPSAANVTITDKKGVEVYKGTTPAMVELKSSAGYFSKAEYHLNFHLNGYDDKTITVTGKLNGWYVGNLLFGGVLGMLIIDPASGAMYKITDTNILESLAPKATAQLQILDINSVPQSARKDLIKLN